MREVRVVPVTPRSFAGVRRVVQRTEVPRELIAGLDTVWSVIRARQLDRHGHNIAVYREAGEETVEMECGVEVGDPFTPEGEIEIRTTPGGTAVCATHVGPVQRIGETYRRIDRWLAECDIAPLGVSWEVYGHASEETGAFYTDIFMLVPADATT